MQEPLLTIKTAPKAHIAIMRKSWGLTEKILSGEKKIELRWYENKYDPWDNICENDDIYFKNAGEPITIKAKVAKVIQHDQLNPKKVKKILDQFANDDGISQDEIAKYHKRFKDKNYCIQIYLSNPQKIRPFNINKAGFGTMSAWLVVEDIEKIKLPIQSRIVQKKMFK